MNKRKQIKPKGKFTLTEKDNFKMLEYHNKGYTLKEIAEAYDISVSTVSARVQEAKLASEVRKMSKGKRYEELDTGKLEVLINAGWPLSKLADEFKKDKKEMDEIIMEWIEDMKEAGLWQKA